jgi:hypothetical protein
MTRRRVGAEQLVAVLRGVLGEIDAGRLDASAVFRARIEGAVVALDVGRAVLWVHGRQAPEQAGHVDNSDRVRGGLLARPASTAALERTSPVGTSSATASQTRSRLYSLSS